MCKGYLKKEEGIAGPPPEGAALGMMAYGKKWPSEYKTLKVIFMNADELKPLGLNTLNIIQWANLWTDGRPKANCVPDFTEVVSIDNVKPDIRVWIQSKPTHYLLYSISD